MARTAPLRIFSIFLAGSEELEKGILRYDTDKYQVQDADSKIHQMVRVDRNTHFVFLVYIFEFVFDGTEKLVR